MTSHTITALATSPSMERNVMMRISSWSIQVLASCPWQMLDPPQMAPSFSSALPRLSGWTASMRSLARWKRAWVSWKPRSSLGPGMAGPARSPLLTVDESNKSHLCFTLTPRHSFCHSGEDPSTPTCLKYPVILGLLLQFYRSHIFLTPVQV